MRRIFLNDLQASTRNATKLLCTTAGLPLYHERGQDDPLLNTTLITTMLTKTATPHT
jgi:hypothetical protein